MKVFIIETTRNSPGGTAYRLEYGGIEYLAFHDAETGEVRCLKDYPPDLKDPIGYDLQPAPPEAAEAITAAILAL